MCDCVFPSHDHHTILQHNPNLKTTHNIQQPLTQHPIITYTHIQNTQSHTFTLQQLHSYFFKTQINTQNKLQFTTHTISPFNPIFIQLKNNKYYQIKSFYINKHFHTNSLLITIYKKIKNSKSFPFNHSINYNKTKLINYNQTQHHTTQHTTTTNTPISSIITHQHKTLLTIKIPLLN